MTTMDEPQATDTPQEPQERQEPQEHQEPEEPQTASDFINHQLQLEADAREVLPYSFDSCSQSLGPLRQTLFACTTCNPPPASPSQVYTAAGICYSCSISCHGDHTLVELFNRRNFVCDCGSTRMPSTSPCELRSDPVTGSKGVHSQQPAQGNRYNHNFQNRFCGCETEYDAEKEKGTMYQCLGLGTVESGGCGEDWWHPECLMGLPKDWRKSTAGTASAKKNGNADAAPEGSEDEEDPPDPPGFPDEDDFEALLCYKCVESNPWIRKYAGTPGFLPSVIKQDELATSRDDSVKPESDSIETAIVSDRSHPNKRKACEKAESEPSSPCKRLKDNCSQAGPEASKNHDVDTDPNQTPNPAPPPQPEKQKHDLLPTTTPLPQHSKLSLLLQPDFRTHLCHCPACFQSQLVPHPQLLEEEASYQPPLSDSTPSSGSNSPSGSTSSLARNAPATLLSRAEAALDSIDRVSAIEGVLVYNKLRDKVKGFLRPYAESGEVVSAEDVKAYFERLRGEEGESADAGAGVGGDDADQRREERGY